MIKLMYNPICILLTMLFISTSILAQDKIGNKIYLYGNLENSIKGKTLIHFEIDDPKVESKMMSKFKKIGVNVVSWNKLFIPGYIYSDSEKDAEIIKKNIETIISIKLKNKSSNTLFISETSYNDSKKSVSTIERTGSMISNVGLIFEIYTKNDGFDKPLALIDGNAYNSWGESESRISLKVISRVLKAMQKEKAFE